MAKACKDTNNFDKTKCRAGIGCRGMTAVEYIQTTVLGSGRAFLVVLSYPEKS